MTNALIDGLMGMPGITIHRITDATRISERVPTVSFTHKRRRSRTLAHALGERHINVWSGHNYAYEASQYLQLDEEDGVLRIGLAHYNTMAEVERVLQAVDELLR